MLKDIKHAGLPYVYDFLQISSNQSAIVMEYIHGETLMNIVESDGKQLVKVIAWYDNEVGYTAQMIRTMKLYM